MINNLIVSVAIPGKSISRICLLLASLQEFGGSWAESPCWILSPQSQGDFSRKDRKRLERLRSEIIPFPDIDGLLRFPLAAKVQAAAAAEELARGKAALLAWLDEDTLILDGLDEFLLPGHQFFGYRPVHHKLLGTAWGEEPDAYWQMVYQRCGADPGKDFPLVSHAGERIRPYFNAGCYTVRPERGILAKWWEIFQDCYQGEEFQQFYQQDPLYAVFLHQAVFTAAALGSLEKEEMQEFSRRINYPLHLHEKLLPHLRVERLDELTTARYENLLETDDWQEVIPSSRELAGWLSAQQKEHFISGGRT